MFQYTSDKYSDLFPQQMEAICPRLPAECRNMIEELIRFDLKVRFLENNLQPLEIELTNETVRPRPRCLDAHGRYRARYKKFYVMTSWTISNRHHFKYLTYYNDELMNHYFHAFKEKKEISTGAFNYYDDIY